ncbi:MAG: VCBS repeat-containing protein [Phycisphaerae bacterium]|nr:VCBS repeat-containing protein [Phycisphaerae bacterium]
MQCHKTKVAYWAVLLCGPIPCLSWRPAFSQTFTDIGANLTGVRFCSLSWGDYDNDGDLDLAIAGNTGTTYVTKIYRNDGGGAFTDIGANLTGVSNSCCLSWGDYDNDGDLDLALAGSGGTIYRNDGNGAFTNIEASLTSSAMSLGSNSLSWGDYNNDGRLDLAIAGGWSIIYRNHGNETFTNIVAGVTDVEHSSLSWGDYDNDGDLDLAIAGSNITTPLSRIYRNNGTGTFTDIAAGLAGVSYNSLSWGDYDNDGDLDLAFAYRIYRNDGDGVFADIAANLTPVGYSSLSWGDYDNDGDLDLAIAGEVDYYTFVAKVYRNDGNGAFTDIGATLTGVRDCSLSWGDYDNDGDLDLAIAGEDSSRTYVSKIYRNNGGVFNTAPAVPTGLSATNPSLNMAVFAWNAATDAQTPAAGLSYNLRVGTSPGDDDVYCGMADLGSGFRRLSAMGNTHKRLSWTLKSLPPRMYYWSVQAIDTAHAGSAWATEQTVLVAQHLTDIGASLTGVGSSSLSWGDYDNDGDLDLAIAGNTGTTYVTKIYRNDGAGAFTDIGANLTGGYTCSLSWGDYDNDGDLDLVIAGNTGTTYVTKIYRNDGGGAFTDIGANLTGVRFCSLSWGDYDNDGDLDLAIAGDTGSMRVSNIYRNDGNGAFTDIEANLEGALVCSLSWGDYDNDGDLDLAVAGRREGTYSTTFSKVYQNDGNRAFTDIGVELTRVNNCSLSWADYDNDGDLDLAIAGYAGSPTSAVSKIYRNDGSVFNTMPTAPTGLSAASPSQYTGVLTWNAATDAQTPAAGLSYNLRVGTSPGDDDVYCGMADLGSGFRRVPAVGNAQKRLSWTLRGLLPITYYWSVQAVDTAYGGSPWGTEAQLTLPVAAADFDRDYDVDGDDWDAFEACATGPAVSHSGSQICLRTDFDMDNDVDQSDFAIFQRCYSGDGNPADPNCAN